MEGSGAALSSWFTLEYRRIALFDFLPPFGDFDFPGEGFLPFWSFRLRISIFIDLSDACIVDRI